MKKRNSRHEFIRSIVRAKEIKTQRAIVDELKEAGFEVTQATISRDITDLGLKKVEDGHYVLAEDLHLHRMVKDLVEDVESVDNLVVIKASPGTAPGVAAALDGAELPDIVGSVAGDDTVLVIVSSKENTEKFLNLLSALRV
ncbi:MAG: ArgR family transcriptional regulator [Coriobacteriia bacterium]|nr:ArgR family transcriptional regulator [Coriobacteriia bacterium]